VKPAPTSGDWSLGEGGFERWSIIDKYCRWNPPLQAPDGYYFLCWCNHKFPIPNYPKFMNPEPEIRRLLDIMPASGRMMSKIINKPPQSTVIDCQFPNLARQPQFPSRIRCRRNGDSRGSKAWLQRSRSRQTFAVGDRSCGADRRAQFGF